MRVRRLGCLLLVTLCLLVSCAPAQPSPSSAPQSSDPSPQSSSAPKRISVSIMDDPPILTHKLGSPSLRGLDSLEELLHVGLATSDNRSTLQPRLAETIPTVENGLWKVLPDGRMETTWKLRPNLVWQDGAPFTAADLVFTARVGQDREVGELVDTALDAVESVEATDPRTVVVRWKRPFIDADNLFTRVGPTRGRLLPLPQHLLEKPYAEDKTNFTSLPYWGDDFVGTGPFRLQSWTRGSHLILRANDRYVLGRPKLDEIEVRFVPDPNTLAANVLAGTLDFTIGRGLDLEQAVVIRDQWRDGTMLTSPSSWIIIWPQFVNPTPAAVADVRFRRAMAHALDRQQMVDTFMGGVSSVAHSYLGPDEADYKEIEAVVPRYAYDPQRALQLVESMGYTRGPDGALRDGAGQRLGLEIRTTTGDKLRERLLLSTADSWQRIGLAVEPIIVSRQLAQDQEYRATFPAFELSRNPNTARDFPNLQSRAARLSENGFRGTGGTNYARYMNPEFDAWIDRYFVTIPPTERLALAKQIVGHMADQVTVIGILYSTDQHMLATRVRNATNRSQGSTETWNAQDWDVQ